MEYLLQTLNFKLFLLRSGWLSNKCKQITRSRYPPKYVYMLWSSINKRTPLFLGGIYYNYITLDEHKAALLP